MTTRRGEPIESEQQSVADILWPLAEARVPRNEAREGEHFTERWTDPDPRFEALRRPMTVARWTDKSSSPVVHVPAGYTLDASLGASVRAAAACGFNIHLDPPDKDDARWGVVLHRPGFADGVAGFALAEHGATPEDALALALVAAWNDEKSHTSTETMQKKR